MMGTLLQDATIVYKIAGLAITTGMMNTILIKMGKKEVAETIDLIIGMSAFGYVVYIVTTCIQSVQQVITLF